MRRHRQRNSGQRSDDCLILGRRTKRKALPMHAQIVFLLLLQDHAQRDWQPQEFAMPPQQRGGTQHGAIIRKADQAAIKQGIQGRDQRQAIMGGGQAAADRWHPARTRHAKHAEPVQDRTPLPHISGPTMRAIRPDTCLGRAGPGTVCRSPLSVPSPLPANH